MYHFLTSGRLQLWLLLGADDGLLSWPHSTPTLMMMVMMMVMVMVMVTRGVADDGDGEGVGTGGE